MAEEWRDVPGYPGYRASSAGRIEGRSGRVLSPYVDGYGYHVVTVMARKQECRKVHRLVAMAFHGAPPLPTTHARHLDGNKGNNASSNLAWGTAAENTADRHRHGTTARGSRQGTAKLTEADVPEIRRLLAEGHLTQRQIGAQYGVTDVVISNIKLGKTWGHA